MNSTDLTSPSRYDTHADLGGRDGFGRVIPEPEGELWHAAWEPKALAVTLAMGATGSWNIDMSRSARETLPDYASLSYYEIWIAGLCRMLIDRGLIAADEITAGRMRVAPKPVTRILHAPDVAAALAKGAPTERAASGPARFAIGDRVRTRSGMVAHHTRLPRYAAGKLGTIARIHGVHVFADANAQGLGEYPQWLYTVSFDGRELWGEQAQAGLEVSIDAWDEYLEPA